MSRKGCGATPIGWRISDEAMRHFALRHRWLAGLLLAVAANAGAVEVNQANLAELEAVKGIGVRLAAKIIDERAHAPFKDWDDLSARVKGIGRGHAARLSAAGLTVNGAALPAAR
jgi:competence protein ComEA